jgi:NAD(P)-dependent dehydrogenase (short-subunit alcohol dehydrogenase family)
MEKVKADIYGNIALQHPIGSGFNENSTADEVINGIDLKGKTAIVTGGYAGLGLETTRVFVAAGAKVIVPARDKEKALKNLEGLENVEIEIMDLADPTSIDAFSERFLASGRPLDLLVNNAGVMWLPLSRDARGYEAHLVTNHLGHFQLNARLWAALKKADGARVVNVSSRGHRYSPFVFEDPNFEHREYETLLAYGQSKTANNLFTVELDHRSKDFGVRAFSVHPGAIVETDLKRLADSQTLKNAGVYDAEGKPVYDPTKGLKSIAQGAATQVWCATNPKLNDFGGVYCEDTEVASLHDGATDDQVGRASVFRGVMAYSIDAENAGKLWTLSEQMTGLTFNI